jgi:PAS domain-containing protein
MATAMVRKMVRKRVWQSSGPDGKASSVGGTAGLRLLSAERSEEIFPILLEEIVDLGFVRALALSVDFETGDIEPAAALKCSKTFLQKFRISLWGDNPVVRPLHDMQPAVVAGLGVNGAPIYCHPILYRNQNLCWEAERERSQQCLAVENFRAPRKLQLSEQVCATCAMRAYAAAVLVEVKKTTTDTQIRQLQSMIELANRYLARLFKVEHYYNRMRDMDVIISQMRTVMRSMADPVILTDTHHRVVMQNKAAERFFRAPEGISEGGARAVELNNLLFSAALSSMAISADESSRDLTLVDVMEGEEVLFEAVCAPTQSSDGSRSGMVTVMRDVTDLRRADQELRANLERLRETEESCSPGPRSPQPGDRERRRSHHRRRQLSQGRVVRSFSQGVAWRRVRPATSFHCEKPGKTGCLPDRVYFLFCR